jgi:hypothetical protein
MPTRSKRRSLALRITGLGLLVIVPGAASAGMQSQGMQSQGMQSQGMQSQGMQSQGMQSQGMQSQGMQSQGMQSQGMQSQGMQSQGMQSQGMQSQGMQSQGVAVIGNDAVIGEFKGAEITFVEMKGTTATSGVASHVLTNIPNMSAGPGNYIAVGGGSAVGHYAVAHLRDAAGNPAEDLDLFIAGEQKDPMPNLFHRAEEQDNKDMLYVVYFFQQGTGQWLSLCPFNPDTGSASAIAIPEKPSADPNKFIFACTATGVASKCARNWGYRPWATTQAWEYSEMTDSWSLAPRKLERYYAACIPAAMAAYCQDGRSYTKNGTLVDLFDTRQIIWPNSVENPFNSSNPISLWMMAQEYFSSTGPSPLNSSLRDTALQRTRYQDLSPSSECGNFAYIDRLEHDHIEDGRWASPLTNTPRIQVFSPNYCPHNEYEVDPRPLAWDCSPCTTKVCQTMPECCGAAATSSWTQLCVNEANAVCKTDGVQWPKGMSWPRDLPMTPPNPVLPKFLQGPAGAVLRVDGTSTTGSSATVSGWACDPEWPGATVGVRIYGGAPRDQMGSVLLAEVRADQALAAPLVNEVALACDGPTRNYTRHGFAYTLPVNHSGNVFVYAIDQATEDGPAAPPTLLRNGIVPVPRCAHSEYVAGAALDAGCSTCAGNVCSDGTHASCCANEWTEECAATAAATCTSAGSSAPVNSHAYTAVTTGWIEAPADGSYTFDSSLQPSRLFINGTTVLDWFETSPGTTQGSITLARGQRYHLRWDRFQAEPPSSSGPGLTWQPPGASGQQPIPSSQLYLLAPGSGTGLTATYSSGGNTRTRRDAFIDINNDVEPPTTTKMDLPETFGLPYSVTWEGEIIPLFTEAYTFTIVGPGTPTFLINDNPVTYTTPITSTAPGGCAHDLCATGPKLDASCNSCVQKVCAKDPYCCDGGYLSYYSFLPEWDARCVAEVETYCTAEGARCAPLPAPGSPEKKSNPIALKAGVHYKISLEYNNTSATDKTVRLLWSSANQGKQVVPTFALYPKAATPTGQGSGLNITLFGTKTTSEETLAPDLDEKPVAAGVVTDLSLTPAVGPTGTPVVDLLASPSDTTAGRPWPPSLVRPRFEDEAFIDGTGQIKIHGVGGIAGAWIHVTVQSVGGADLVVPVGSDGQWTAQFHIDTGWQKLRLVQQTYATSPCAELFCAESDPLIWPVKVTLETASPNPPVIFSPIDPAHDPSGAGLFTIVGKGTSGEVKITEQGNFAASVNPDHFDANEDGSFSKQVHLSDGVTDPNKGWHKLVFSQGGGPFSQPVFVSVGIKPPTVEFPRTGAELDCNKPDPPQFEPVVATGILPYREDEFGRLRILEETGRSALREVPVETEVIPPPQGQGPIRFRAQIFGLSQGDHVLYFVQAPEPPGQPTPAEREAYFRGLAAIADTPTSRIVIKQPPPRFDLARGGAITLRGTQLNINLGNCVIGQKPPGSLCAEPRADVILRVGERVYTTRASAVGNWNISVEMPPGWSDVTFAQVTDSEVGGAWAESCRSNSVAVGVITDDRGPVIKVPPDITVVATSSKGTKVTYDVNAQTESGEQVPVECVPPSGSIFPIGTTHVRCKAVDPRTGAVGLAGFIVTVVDGPPVVKVPPGIVAEATSALGAVVSFEAKAEDVVDGPLPVECVPASPALFPLDETSEVICRATDTQKQTTSEAFKVKVVDTTPPELCHLPDIKVRSTSATGAFVAFDTCAKDLVDGPTAVGCDHPSGSFFPIGRTVVSCSSVDRHGNTSPPKTFVVQVGDGTPPKLKLPGTITAAATSRNGARVKYVVSATDNVDPDPVVACSPPSGALFPLGSTIVKCKATDDAGNTSEGTFTVRVLVAFKGLLPPIADDGSSRFLLGLPIPLRFELTGASANIFDLQARLFIAPINAAGVPGPERPAAGLPPGASNLFYFLPIINQYAMLLDTRPMAVGAWQLRIDLGDGEIHTERLTLLRK